MAVGWSVTAGNSALTTLTGTYDFIQLHVGDPGSAGTANVATENTRMEATFGTASGGSISTTADLEWLDVPAAEDFTHFSVWTLVTGGTFGFSGTITANAVGIGDDFVIQTGDLTVSVDVAA
jgi:hypothetical protein